MHTFLFNIVPYLKNITPQKEPTFVEVSYIVEGSKVILMDLGIPPFMFPLIADNWTVHNDMFYAAQNNANSYSLVKYDLFHTLGKLFKHG